MLRRDSFQVDRSTHGSRVHGFCHLNRVCHSSPLAIPQLSSPSACPQAQLDTRGGSAIPVLAQDEVPFPFNDCLWFLLPARVRQFKQLTLLPFGETSSLPATLIAAPCAEPAGGGLYPQINIRNEHTALFHDEQERMNEEEDSSS